MSAATEERAPRLDPAWRTDALDLDAYLARIGYDGPREPTVAVLDAVHRAHASTFPFENIDVVLGVQPKLDLPSVQRKLVGERRGGLCFELIVLFGAALEHLGFGVSRLMARPLMGARDRQAKTHAALIVEAEGRRHLADIAFGGEGLQESIELVDGAETQVGSWRWQVTQDGDRWVLRTMHPTGWFDLYEFIPGEPCPPVDFEVGNFFVAKSPTSKFAGFLLVQRGRPDVKHYVVGRKLITIEPGGQPRQRDMAPAEIAATVRETFQLDLSDEIAEKLAGLAAPGDRVWD
jgi:N-hydroxyarylamine O-acetyltransferase